jgi:hypothetical protein
MGDPVNVETVEVEITPAAYEHLKNLLEEHNSRCLDQLTLDTLASMIVFSIPLTWSPIQCGDRN